MPDKLARIADNTWAFGMFILAAALAIGSHFWHDKDILHFAETISMTGAALFHGKDRDEKRG